MLYFGRYSEEKGIKTLVSVCKQLIGIQFVFAGSGPLESAINAVDNIRNVGFQNGEQLRALITGAEFSVYPSEWYENGPFSVIESISLGTPVIGANIGGIPELIDNCIDGELFISGSESSLADAISSLWNDSNRLRLYQKNCSVDKFLSIEDYYNRIMSIYMGD